MKRRSLSRLTEELSRKYLGYSAVRDMSDGDRIQRCVERGQPIPDHLLPGRIIMKLSGEDRELLAQAQARDFYHRLFQ